MEIRVVSSYDKLVKEHVYNDELFGINIEELIHFLIEYGYDKHTSTSELWNEISAFIYEQVRKIIMNQPGIYGKFDIDEEEIGISFSLTSEIVQSIRELLPDSNQESCCFNNGGKGFNFCPECGRVINHGNISSF